MKKEYTADELQELLDQTFDAQTIEESVGDLSAIIWADSMRKRIDAKRAEEAQPKEPTP